MLLGEILRVALQSIRANIIRSCLTMLGIIIGVAAVITMLAAGSGAQQQIEDQIDALGANVLNITAETWFLRGVARDALTLEVEDVWALREHAQYLDAVVPTLEDRGQITYDGRNSNTRLVGTTADYADIFNYDVQYGRMFTEAEDQARQRVAVAGSAIPQYLGIDNPPDLLGQRVFMRGIPFTVVGILKEIGGSFNNPGSTDHTAGANSRNPGVRLGGPGGHQRSRGSGCAAGNRHGGRGNACFAPNTRSFPVSPTISQSTTASSSSKPARRRNRRLPCCWPASPASACWVGGIGIMNIMLVSVTERTREIGVRMALGATRLNIMTQFLIEAVALCLLGGALGVAAGAGMATLLSRTAGWAVYISPESILLAVAFSLGVGLFFGLLPARRAAALESHRGLALRIALRFLPIVPLLARTALCIGASGSL